jgi:hypothetical protein
VRRRAFSRALPSRKVGHGPPAVGVALTGAYQGALGSFLVLNVIEALEDGSRKFGLFLLR